MAKINAVIDIKVRFRRLLIAYNCIRCIIGMEVHVPRFAFKVSKPYFKNAG
jgi:hypothetical protein